MGLQCLVDTGATKNIMCLRCFKEMGLKDDHRKPNGMVLEGFSTHKVHVKDTARMQVTLEDGKQLRTEEIKLYVVDLD